MADMEEIRYIRGFARVREALKDWATRLHAHQTWVNSRPYSDHLEAVEQVLLRYGYSDPENPLHQVLRLAAWAHDLIEDAGVDRITLRVLQGPDVEALVWAVSDERGGTRAERHLSTYRKIRETPWAVLLKLADRTANVEASIEFGPAKMLELYRKEHPDFRAALYVAGQAEEPMWAHLDQLLAISVQGPEVTTTLLVPVQRGLFEE